MAKTTYIRYIERATQETKVVEQGNRTKMATLIRNLIRAPHSYKLEKVISFKGNVGVEINTNIGNNKTSIGKISLDLGSVR